MHGPNRAMKHTVCSAIGRCGEGNVPIRTSHFFYAALTPQEAVASVQFFVGAHDLPPPSRIRLATNPQKFLVVPLIAL
jgi:hypothetical protein